MPVNGKGLLQWHTSNKRNSMNGTQSFTAFDVGGNRSVGLI
jgi:hypothetical protein